MTHVAPLTSATLATGILRDARVPAALCRLPGTPDAEGFLHLDLSVRAGRFAASGTAGPADADLGGRIVLPGFVDMHVHLDKTYTAARAGVSRTGLAEAVDRAMADLPNRTLEDLEARMQRAVAAAWRQGTVAMRSHLDSMGMPEGNPAWEAFARVRRAWAGRMHLQAVALMRIDRAVEDGFAERCAQIAARDALAGGYIPAEGCPPAMVDAFLNHAGAVGLDVDFHVDESLEPGARGIETVLDSLARTGFAGRVTLGHCCALSAMEPARAEALIALMAAAGVHVVSLPLTNAYLLDRAPGATPRHRGLTRVHELRAAGVPVSFASDNVQDPFYPWGGYDLFDIFRQAVLSAQLDAAPGDWIASVAARPAATMGLPEAGTIAPGAPADLVVFDATDWAGLMSRAHEDRRVFRAGLPIDRRDAR